MAVPVTATRDPMLPVPYQVIGRRAETRDSVTLRLQPMGERLRAYRPGQFTMLYSRGVGEIAISISGDHGRIDGSFTVTVREVGAASAAVHSAGPGHVLGVRGPFGTDWGLENAAGRDLVVVAGGVGLAPLRSMLQSVLADRARYGRVTLIAGARSPAEFLFDEEIAEWSTRADLDVVQTVDKSAAGWRGPVGFVTEPLGRLRVVGRTTAFICGPEPMMRLSAEVLLDKGIAATDIMVSLERNMKCGVGLCGHCQLGPLLVCRDGPVIDYAQAAPLLAVREL
jgi:NAD(P)H-flavin reductase